MFAHAGQDLSPLELNIAKGIIASIPLGNIALSLRQHPSVFFSAPVFSWSSMGWCLGIGDRTKIGDLTQDFLYWPKPHLICIPPPFD